MPEKEFECFEKTIALDNNSIYCNRNISPYLIIYLGNDSGQRIKLNRGATAIGRSADADIRIKDYSISRIHCIIEWFGDAIVIKDEGSTNGTFVDGLKIDQTILYPGIPFQIGQSLMKIENKSEAEIQAEEELVQNATFDAVTGLFNRQHFNKLAQIEVTSAYRNGLPIGVILFDIDNFKQVNDQFGHHCGDLVLAQVADLIVRNKHSEDLFARYGGDEFIILPRGITNKNRMLELSERIRSAVKRFDFQFDGSNIPLTVSIGFHIIKPKISNPNNLLDKIIYKADKALYRAKNGGKNQTKSLI